MNSISVRAVIPVGFTREPWGNRPIPENFVFDGLTLLSRSLCEATVGGISNALIVIPSDEPCRTKAHSAVEASLHEMNRQGIVIPEIDFFEVVGCVEQDRAIDLAVISSNAEWNAVICPLIHCTDFEAISRILSLAMGLQRSAVGVCEVGWETAIQLCCLEVMNDRVKGIVDIDPRSECQKVYTGRSVINNSYKDAIGSNSAFGSDGARLLSNLLSASQEVPFTHVMGSLEDYRFRVLNSEVNVPTFKSVRVSR